MSFPAIVTYPNALLKQVSMEVDFSTEVELPAIFEFLKRALKKYPGVGVAAIQLGFAKRLFIMNSSYNKQYRSSSSGQIILINPEIVESKGLLIFREGCLSVPEYTANIKRQGEITLRYYDEKLQQQQRTFYDFEAVIVQHEYDHLEGKLFLDRISTPKELFRRESQS